MFEINSYILQKMGWTMYYTSYGLGPNLANLFNDDDLVRFFILDDVKKLCYIIKEMSPEEKQKTKNSYKFIRFNIPSELKLIDIKKLNLKVDFFNSNESLIKLVIENEACNEDYQRHFKLNKILNK
jgi:hypothetical protein